MPSAHRTALTPWALLVGLSTVLPWINPFTWGPNPAMVQTLLSGLCAAVLLCCGAWGQPSARALAHAVAGAWLLAALLSAVAGLLQYFGLADVRTAPWINAADLGQAYANLRQRNQFASLTSLGLLALLYLAGEHAGAGHRRLRLGAIALALVWLALGNAASGSRTGALQWVLIVALSLLWERNGQRATLRWSALALGLYLTAALLLPNISASSGHLGDGPSLGVLERFQENSGCADRTVLWRNVVELIAQKPWLGWGWGGLKFAHFIHPYPGDRFCEILDNAHNLPLHLAVELGLPAAVLLCAAVLGAVAWAKPWRETQTARQLAWAGLAIIGLHSLLEYPLWYGPFQLAVGLCLWLLWATRRAPAPAHPMRAATVTALAACALPLLAYAGWDYARVSQLFLPPTLRAEAYREDTLEKVRGSWLFRNEVLFAEVTTTPPTPENAAALYAGALETLRFSPEPKVIAALLESARMLGHENAITQRIRAQALAVYPNEF
ncbi:Wzy polymerase domain-containing protein [Rhodoferax saidenbachensis]|uniref:O-antigen ligase n=1 Tax=Rhodoferax saidenbachensis TaxID=1484693 RepID=A0ABU1ZP33_9BURK|nr:Wzy polymerase domain-containing protein [Rhodoferax saidenbachensis]MDR7307307.1 O-antigen ligase [Rhodoferax saidenbachensis]